MTSELARLLARKKDSSPARQVRRTADAPDSHPLLKLQRQVGNATVSRLIAQRAGAAEEEEVMMKRDPALQRQEEEELQAKHDPALAQRQEEEELAMKRDPALQRQEGGAAEEEEMMMKRDPAPTIGLAGGPVGPDIESTIDSKRGAGSTLDAGFQQKMESSLNTSLADVRIHNDDQSDALNRTMTAKAFTTGSDIFLRKDVSPSDHDTMAHEVAHVVQQRDMPGGGGGGMTVGAADTAYEREADEVAHAVNSGAKLDDPEHQ